MADQTSVRDAPVSAAPASYDYRALQALKAETERALIGTEAFTAEAMTRHANAAHSIASATGMRRHQRLAVAIRGMITDPFMPHTVASIAKTAGMSRSSFAQSFTRTFEQSPLDFLRAERLRFAAHLVWTTSLPVKTIASRIGYASVSYFSRAFYDAFGIPPSVLRDIIRQDGSAFIAQPDGMSTKIVSLQGKDRDAADVNAAYERLRLVCDTTIDVVWDIDLLTGQVRWSEGMLQAFGYGPEQIGPDTAWCHEHIHPDDRKRVVESMHAACNNGDSFWQSYFRYLKADGDYAFVADRGTIIRDATSKAVRFVGTMHDITVGFDEHTKSFTRPRRKAAARVAPIAARMARAPANLNVSEEPAGRFSDGDDPQT